MNANDTHPSTKETNYTEIYLPKQIISYTLDMYIKPVARMQTLVSFALNLKNKKSDYVVKAHLKFF